MRDKEVALGGFQTLIELILNGERVDAGVTNRPIRQLVNNVNHVKALLDLAALGQNLVLHDKTVKSDVNVGQPVHFNAQTLQFEKALAQVDADPTTEQLVTTASAQVWGVVLRKHNATKADILLRGVAEFDLSAAVSGTVTAGLYYLSASEPGKLVQTRPPVGVRVLQVSQPGAVSGSHEVFVNPQFVDFLESHRHAKFQLVAAPAGDHAPPAPGGTHEITNPDTAVEGWLPADHTVFDSKAPAGAKFGYNLSASSLGNIWPPVPVQNAVLQMYRHSINAGTDLVPQLSEVPQPEIVVLDQHGIWWMTDCYDSVPWPTDLDTDNPTSLSVSECLPLQQGDVRLELWYTSSLFFNSDFGVLSLTGRTGSGLKFFCQGTNDEKSLGHLEADLDLSLLDGDTNRVGHLVVKDIEDRSFHFGPVVESIRSVSPELVITSNVAAGPNGERYGNLVIAADLDLDGAEFLADTVSLDGAEEEMFQDTLALGFKTTRRCAFRGRIQIPSRVTLPAGTKMKLRFWVLGRVAGSLPNGTLALTHRVLSRPTAVLTDKVELVTSDSALGLATAAVFGAANEYIEIESDGFEVASGDQVLFTLAREAPDGYAGELHILRKTGVLVVESET